MSTLLRKLPILFVTCGLIIYIILVPLSKDSSALDGPSLEPAEIVERAEIVVYGQFDFKQGRQGGNDLFWGYDFHVEKVYHGEARERMIVGVNGHDQGAVESRQESGSKYLLFLEYDPHAGIHVPVNGAHVPDGMIPVTSGEVNNDYWAKYLEQTEAREPDPVIQPLRYIIAGTALFVLFVIGYMWKWNMNGRIRNPG